MKIGQKKWIDKLADGFACFSPIGDFIKKSINTGNDEQGDKYEGVFARLKRNDFRISEMRKQLGDDLEEINDGKYILLRRKSSKTVPVFCIYGFFQEHLSVIRYSQHNDGEIECRLAMKPSKEMFEKFLNSGKIRMDEGDINGIAFSVGHLQEAINDKLVDRGVKHQDVKVIYDLFDEDEFFIEPKANYPELQHKSKRLSYQNELRIILPEIHKKEKYIIQYTPLSSHSMGHFVGEPYFECTAIGHIKNNTKIEGAYKNWKQECEDRFLQLKENEEELNRIFIDIYGLQDELTPDVADKDITVHRIYNTKDDVPESMKGSKYVRTKHDEIVSLISYAVGCMFGRYSLDKEGLVFAGGNFDEVYISDAIYPSDNLYPSDSLLPKNPEYTKLKTDDGLIDLSFYPDYDNVIPITDEEYFEDDIVGLLCSWLKKVYGEDTLEENLDFIADALGNKGKTSREVIRNYFLTDFIKDHIKTYQKRPIYWLFDSGKQNGFKALVYMHRWNADTIGNVRVEYLHRIQRVYEKEITRMQEIIDNSHDNKEISNATKRKEKLQKQIKETKDYDAKIAHLALSRIDIDLDDGVKVNYEKVQTADGKKMQILAKI